MHNCHGCTKPIEATANRRVILKEDGKVKFSRAYCDECFGEIEALITIHDVEAKEPDTV
jgi:hypothetical protein